MKDGDHLSDIPKNAAQVKALEGILRQLEAGVGGELLQEMARDVLAGRVGLREAVTSEAYRDVFESNMVKFLAWYDQLSMDQIDQLASAAESYLNSDDSA